MDIEVDEALRRIRTRTHAPKTALDSKNEGLNGDDFERKESLQFARDVFLGLDEGIILSGTLPPETLLRDAMARVRPLLSPTFGT